jgi:septum formation protein
MWLIERAGISKMNLPPLILASASPRRRELLRQIRNDFEVVVSHVAEIQGEHLTPRELVRINAYRKARAVAKSFPDSLVIAADTVVCLENRIFGKPLDLAEASRMLEQLKGQTHEVITGVCMVHLREHRQKVFAESTRVTFRPLTSGQIRDYLRQIDPLDKAGGYAIQEHGDALVERLSGSFSNVVGLPMEMLSISLISEGSLGIDDRAHLKRHSYRVDTAMNRRKEGVGLKVMSRRHGASQTSSLFRDVLSWVNADRRWLADFSLHRPWLEHLDGLSARPTKSPANTLHQPAVRANRNSKKRSRSLRNIQCAGEQFLNHLLQPSRLQRLLCLTRNH